MAKRLKIFLLYRDKITDELENLVSRDERLFAEQEKLAQLLQDLEIEAEELSIIRQNSSIQLENAIMEQLEQLHMGKASFKVDITRKSAGTFDSNGYDDVTFLNLDECWGTVETTC